MNAEPRTMPMESQLEYQVYDVVQPMRSQWPSRVLIVGWAAELRTDKGYQGFELDGAEIWNPVEVLSGHIQQEIQFHNLANLLPKDPAVELSLD